MAYDTDLAGRIRDLIASEPGLSEKQMFGGLAFLLDGRMSVVVSAQGGLLLRCDPAAQASLLLREHTSPFIMHGREARGWLRVEASALEDEDDLAFWVEHGVNYAQELPPRDPPDQSEVSR